MIFVWQFKRPKGRSLVGTYLTFTASKRSFQRLRVSGLYVGSPGDVRLWQPEWSDVRRLVMIEDYDDAGVEGRLRHIASTWRVFLKSMGRRISTTAVKYCFPQDLRLGFARRSMGVEENARPTSVEATIEID